MRHLAIALALITLGGCATSPSAPSTTPPAAAAVAAQTPAVNPAVTTTTELPPGYRVVERKGVRLLCTRKTESGSRLNKETCMTEAQYREMQARGEDPWVDLDNSIKVRPTCTAGSCAGGSN